MDKNEILAKSRQENQFGQNDDYYKEIRQKGIKFACVTVVVLCIVFFIIEKYNKSYIVIANAFNAVIYIYQAVKFKTKSDKIVATIWIISTLIWLTLYILERFNIFNG